MKSCDRARKFADQLHGYLFGVTGKQRTFCGRKKKKKSRKGKKEKKGEKSNERSEGLTMDLLTWRNRERTKEKKERKKVNKVSKNEEYIRICVHMRAKEKKKHSYVNNKYKKMKSCTRACTSELLNVLFSVLVAACLSSLFFAPEGGSA